MRLAGHVPKSLCNEYGHPHSCAWSSAKVSSPDQYRFSSYSPTATIVIGVASYVVNIQLSVKRYMIY